MPPPFVAVATEATAVKCCTRRYDLSGTVPMPTVAGRALVEKAELILDGKPAAASQPEWVRVTPAVGIAKRAWTTNGLHLTLLETVEYDGFITSDLTLAPAAAKTVVRDLSLRLTFKPDASTLYHISSSKETPAGVLAVRAAFHGTDSRRVGRR